MKSRHLNVIALLLCIVLVLVGCARTQTLKEVLTENPQILDRLPYNTEPIVCKDYTLYNTGGGVNDAINATRYASGLRITTDRFNNYRYVVQDNQTNWKYFFENHRDIAIWVNNFS